MYPPFYHFNWLPMALHSYYLWHRRCLWKLQNGKLKGINSLELLINLTQKSLVLRYLMILSNNTTRPPISVVSPLGSLSFPLVFLTLRSNISVYPIFRERSVMFIMSPFSSFTSSPATCDVTLLLVWSQVKGLNGVVHIYEG